MCSAWLGVGGSLFIVPLLPFLSPLDSLETLQVSLCLIFIISLVNLLSFTFQKLILWSWFIRCVFIALASSFASGFFVTFFHVLQIRFILWLFLALILMLPFLLKRKGSFLKEKGIYIFGSLMGICSGFTGLGGGMILSPFLHESKIVPTKNISALVASVMFFVSTFALLGQLSQINFLVNSSSLWFTFFLLLVPSLFGLIFGYYVNIKQKKQIWRRLLLRALVLLMFLHLSLELMGSVF